MSTEKKQKFVDIAFGGKQKQNIQNRENSKSTLFSRGKKTDRFFTEDSKLYITPRQQQQLRKGIKLDRDVHKWDSLSSRIANDFVRYQPSATSVLVRMLEQRLEILNETVNEASQSIAGHFSLIRLWNLSIVGSILFGMVTMTFIYRYLGQGAAADQIKIADQAVEQTIKPSEGKILGAEIENDSFEKQVREIEQANDQQALEKQIRQMVKGHPIEAMVPYIAKKDRTVAAFLVGIAKKESGWGDHHPVLNGQDCYNYWGYRGQRKLMGSGGHTCFNSPKDAVDTVAKRLDNLINEKGKNTPSKMVNTWKCGTSCEGDSGAAKWVSDVTMYYDKLNAESQ